MGDHGDRAVLRFFKELERIGFTVTRKRSGGYIIKPPANNPNQRLYMTHGTSKALKPLKKQIAKWYGVEIGE